MPDVIPLKLEHLTKSYGSFRGIEDISMELRGGEVFGFLGPNGAGKSTAIRTMLNFISPTSGTAKIYGMDSVAESVTIKHHVGYLAGDIALYKTMSGQELLKFLTKLGKSTDWSYVHHLTTQLNANLQRPIHTLSKGNVQKIGLIQAFMHKPDLLILDEPTSGLDPLMKQVFYDMVLDMKEAGKTILISSHDLSEVQKICDRAAFIRDGKLLGIEDIKNAQPIAVRRYQLTFATPPKRLDLDRLKTVSTYSLKNKTLSATVIGNVTEFIQEISKYQLIDLAEQETNLEDVFMHYYEGKNNV